MKEDVSKLRGDWGGVIKLGLLHSECDKEPLSEPIMDLGYLGVKGILIRSVLYCKLLEEPSLALDGNEFEP